MGHEQKSAKTFDSYLCLRAAPTVSLELKFPVELNSFSVRMVFPKIFVPLQQCRKYFQPPSQKCIYDSSVIILSLFQMHEDSHCHSSTLHERKLQSQMRQRKVKQLYLLA